MSEKIALLGVVGLGSMGLGAALSAVRRGALLDAVRSPVFPLLLAGLELPGAPAKP